MVKIAYDNSTERLFGIAQFKQSIDLTSDKLMMLKKPMTHLETQRKFSPNEMRT